MESTRAAELKFKSAIDYWQKDNNIDAAIQEFEEYLELYPKGERILVVYTNLGRLYLVQRQYHKAIVLYTECYSRYPDHREGMAAKLQSCRLYHLIGENRQSIDCYKVMIQEFHRFPDIFRQAKIELSAKFPDEIQEKTVETDNLKDPSETDKKK